MIFMAWFDSRHIELEVAVKDDCKECLRHITSDSHAGKTNRAFAAALKRLVHSTKTEEIGEKKNGKVRQNTKVKVKVTNVGSLFATAELVQ